MLQIRQAAVVLNGGFFTVIVVKPNVFESQIVDERHFSTYEEAEWFKLQIALNHKDLICVVCEFREV
ncbi:hypothetical protein [Bacteroides acidifaciens]|uniref:hypothetical protein n=1 Tax=Bacteroides acidifaciens TaxID=85831 RepID=UPI0027145DED|nr:hypothetical protein [Bacteroides acidifaciens]